MPVQYVEAVKNELNRRADPARAEHSYGFFKAVPGGYGEGDRFLGVPVPDQRKIARKYYREIPLAEVEALLRDPVHECRLTALFMLRLRFEKACKAEQKQAARLPGFNSAGLSFGRQAETDSLAAPAKEIAEI
jgi:hypothetical protein